MQTNEELLKQIASEVTDPDVLVEATKSKVPFYKLINRNPKVVYDETNPFKPGIRVSKDGEPVQSVRAVILYSSDARRWQRNVKGQDRPETVCCSYDGLTPAPKIKEPQCKKLDSAGIAAVLGKFKGYDEAKITSTTADLTESTGKLQYCAMKTKSGGIPICPKARWNEEAQVSGPCKPYVHVIAYDIERKQLFKMDLTGRSIDGGKKGAPASPFQQYKAWLADKRVPYYHISIALTPKQDGAFYTLDVSDFQPVADPAERGNLKQMAEAAKESYFRTATWVEPTEADKKAAEEKKLEAKKYEPEVTTGFDEDEIPF